MTARDGLNGLVVWGLGVVVSVMLLGSAVSTTVKAAGAVASGAGAVAGSVAQATGTVVGDVAKGAISAAGAMVPAQAVANPVDYLNNTLLRATAPGASKTPHAG